MLLTLLMVAPVFPLPTAAADHTGDVMPPRAELPHARPTDECLQVALPAEILATVNDVMAGDTTRFSRDEMGVPAICDASGRQILSEWATLVRDADELLEDFRNASLAVSRQYEQRLEHMLPGGSRTECELLRRTMANENQQPVETIPLACDLLRPQVTLLQDAFDGRRIGGFGNWTVVTARGEEPVFRPGTVTNFNGTFHTMRFGSDTGYERGAHQFLVSPEIDLSVVAGTVETMQTLYHMRDQSRRALYMACNELLSQGMPDLPDFNGGEIITIGGGGTTGFSPLSPVCGEVSPIQLGGANQIGVMIVRAYERAFDDALETLPVMTTGATLEFYYRMNMAEGTDGVRVWMYTGDKAPTRVELFGNALAESTTEVDCPGERTATGQQTVDPNTGFLRACEGEWACDATAAQNVGCAYRTTGGTVIHVPGRTKSISAIERGDGVIQERDGRNLNFALTGNQPDFTRVEFNLTYFIPQRAWLIFEVVTEPDYRGRPFFDEPGTFPRYGDFGFDVTRVKAVADGYHRNTRVKDVLADLELQRPFNRDDDPESVHTILPPGNEPILVRLQNAGQYRENGTLTVEVRRYASAEDQPPLPPPVIGQAVIPIRNLTANEVRELRVGWDELVNPATGAITFPGGISEFQLYRVTARLDVDKGEVPGVGFDGIQLNDSYLADPNNTAVRTPNAAELPPGPPFPREVPQDDVDRPFGKTSVVADAFVRVYTRHELTPVAASPPREDNPAVTYDDIDPLDGAMLGNPLEICSSFTISGGCDDHYAGERGEPRVLALKIRNDGSVRENVLATLTFRLNGVDMGSTIQGNATQELNDVLVGEERLVTWTVTPTEPGAYLATVSFRLANDNSVTFPNVERHVYVQRTTGTICFDNMGDNRACTESFAASYPDALGRRFVTAATMSGDGLIFAATPISTTEGTLFQRDADGVWRPLLNLSQESLASRATGARNATHGFATIRDMLIAPDGTLYMVGDNATVLARTPGGAVVSYPIWEGAQEGYDYRGAAWFNGTLWAVADQGGLFFLNGSRMDQVHLSYGGGGDVEPTPFLDALNDILVHGSTAYVAGANGFIFNATGANWRTGTPEALTASWKLARSQDNFVMSVQPLPEDAPVPQHRDILSLHRHGSRIYAVGADGLVLVNSPTNRWSFSLVDAPFLNPGADQVEAFTTHRGELFLIDENAVFATCSRCVGSTPGWSYPQIPVPRVAAGETSRPPRLTVGLAADDTTVVLGEDGIVLELGARGQYENAGEWATVPSLFSQDGVFQTTYPNGKPQAFRGSAPPEAQADIQAAERYRVTLKHHVAAASEAQPALVRLLAVYPSIATQPPSQETCPTSTSGPLATACQTFTLGGEPTRFVEPTRGDSWVVTEFEVDPILKLEGYRGAPLLTALEFYRSHQSVRWAVDEARVDALVGGTWRTIIEFTSATDPTQNVGTWADYRVNAMADPVDDALLDATNGAAGFPDVDGGPAWELRTDTFGYETQSAWHVTHNLADRPVWVVNDELLAGTTSPHLLSNWNTRLLSPIVNLSSAYDPVIEFRHAYAFRMKLDGERYYLGDVGVLEVQWERTADECRRLGQEPPCWSPFYKVLPEDGYPGRRQAIGPAAENFTQEQAYDNYAEPGLVGAKPHLAGRAEGYSYWGRSEGSRPDEKGVISGPRFVDSDAYKQVRIVLGDQYCGKRTDDGCLPINLTGRNIRVAFHHIAPYVPGSDPWLDYRSDQQADNPTSFAGEGWYISDFKVLGARLLGIDLASTNLSFRVGYDASKIGVGPGTTVPVNVTIENRGAFEAPGYTGALEIRRVIDPTSKRTVFVERIPLAQQPALDVGEHRNHTFDWNVPDAEFANYTLSFVASPIGIEVDEDVTDNLALLGTITQPVLARTVRQFEVDFVVTPENATIDITRYVPIYIRNTGNVPLDDFTVRRNITILRVPEETTTQEWTTSRAVAAGATVPLASISEDLNPATDLFWKAPDRANFRFRVEAETEELAASSQKLVAAFATYLFDDADNGPRGESTRGEWQLEGDWGLKDPGFLTTYSYGFGDPDLARYPEDANSSAVTPVIDISGARSARLAFYHRYDFEPRFDGGLVEASADGGLTWTPLQPLPDTLNDLPIGYNDTEPLAAVSPLHPDGDPTRTAYGFTGSSCELPTATDCWVVSQFDLTKFPPVRETGVVYEIHNSEALSRLTAVNGSIRLGPENVSRAYGEQKWNLSVTNPHAQWYVENLSELDVTPPTGDSALWWSGSVLYNDDGKSVQHNQKLTIPIDLTDPALVADTQRKVVVDWWEWVDRYGQRPVTFLGGKPTLPATRDLLSAYVFHSSADPSQNYRINLSTPTVVERRGMWYHMQSDITEHKGKKLDVSFVYSPMKNNVSLTAPAGEIAVGNIVDSYHHDRGFAIDGFTVRTFVLANGQVFGESVALNESQAWNLAKDNVRRCAGWLDSHARITPSKLPCFVTTSSGQAKASWVESSIPAHQTGMGLTWNVTSHLPAVNASWHVVKVRDHDGDRVTSEGLDSYAWWTGDIACHSLNHPMNIPTRSTCMLPGAESRLVTPAFDLSRIAGTTAELTFRHRYGFPTVTGVGWEHYFASGGVVEIQEYDPQTKQWLNWTQLYAGKLDPGNTRVGSVPPSAFVRGGYSGYTVDSTPAGGAAERRHDSPFQATYDEERKRSFQYLYSGKSTDHCSTQFGWCDARFDLTNWLGKTVRFGFHAHMNGLPLAQVANRAGGTNPEHLLYNPDTDQPSVSKGGWWIGDVAIRGDVLKGSPILLRLRAATDGNVNDGYWQVDDLGVYGSRYANNVGIFVNEDPNAFGMLVGTETTIPVTIRNLGDSVRRNLAVEVRFGNQAETLNVTGDAPLGVQYTSINGKAVVRFPGYTLAPGQAATVNVVVAAGPVAAITKGNLSFKLVEFNSGGAGSYAPITNNEVQGFLKRTVVVTTLPKGLIDFPSVAVTPLNPVVGEPVEVKLTARNYGFGNVGVELGCSAASIEGWNLRRHPAQHDDVPVIARTYPCEVVENVTQLGTKETGDLVYRVVPEVAGPLRFSIEGRRIDGVNESLGPEVVTVIVGEDPLILGESFDEHAPTLDRWGFPESGAAHWSHVRGFRGTGAVVLGVNESDGRWRDDGGSASYASGACESKNCTIQLRTPVVDLHNFTRESVFMSFWHMDRFAYGDGGDVRVEVLRDETKPNQDDSWSGPCRIRPDRGYEDHLLSQLRFGDTGNIVVNDVSPAIPDGTYSSPGPVTQTPERYFVSDKGRWEESWTLDRFDLSQTLTCPDVEGMKPIGNKVRFVFTAFIANDQSGFGLDEDDKEDQVDGGGAFSAIVRGRGHGWIIDDVSISVAGATIRPDSQKATLLDNTTKGFHVIVRNDGNYTDLVRLGFDSGNSSAPAGSVQPPAEPIELAAGESRQVRVNVTLPRDPSLLPTQFRARLNVESVHDPNAFGRSDLELLFAPREWAELAISVEPPRVDIQEGAEVFLPITVENTGLVASVPSVVRIIDSYPGLPDVVTELELPSMSSYYTDPEDATRVLEFRWRPARGTLGEHTLTFVVDPIVLGEEYTRSNNVEVLRLPVVEVLIPDLDIGYDGALTLRNPLGASVPSTRDGDVSRYSVSAGELVTLELKIRNNGRAGATNVDVLASIGPLNLPAKNIPYVAPGGEVLVRFNWLAQKGDYDLAFKVRSEQVELTTTNNDHPALGVVRLTVKGFEVGVLLDAVDDILDPGAEILIPFTLHNEGNAGEEIRLLARADGVNVSIERPDFFLREGETLEGVVAVVVPDDAVAGEHVITVQAVSRENPMKVATAETPVHVAATYGGAVLGGVAQVAPPTFKLPIRLLNDGNSLEPWTLNVHLPAGWTAREALPTRVVVPAHGQIVHEITVNAPEITAPQQYPVRINATLPDGTTREGEVLVDIRPLRTASVRLAGDTPRAVEGALAYPVLVENVGNTRAPFEMLLLQAPEGVEVSVQPSVFELPPGGKTVATLVVKPSADLEAREVELHGYALFEGVQPNTAEGRANIQRITVSLSRPDLRVGVMDVSPRAGVEPGDRVEIKVPIENRGGTPVADMPVHLYVDDVFVAETRVSIAPGERADATINWTAMPGDHTLTVEVDPYREAAEADRADNAVSALTSVAGQSITGGIAAGSPVPGPGAWGAIVALAVALLIFSPKRQRRPPE